MGRPPLHGASPITKERTRDVSTSQGGVYLDIEKTAWSPIITKKRLCPPSLEGAAMTQQVDGVQLAGWRNAAE